MAAFQLSPDKSDVYGLSPQAPPATLHCESHPSSSTDSCENPASGDVIEAIFGTAKPATGTPKLDSRTLKLDPAKPKSASNFDLLAIKSASKSASNFDPAASKSLKFDLRAIKSESKLSEIIAKFIPIQKNGAEFSAICPFHADKKPSLSINDEKGVYLCRACGAAGDVISFVMDYSQIGFEQACEYLGGRKDPIVGNPGLQEKRAVPSPYDTLKL